MLPLPRKHTLRCTECCACHDFGNGISKVLRLPRFREPRAAHTTTSQPFRQLPNAAPATQTHTQMHRMLRLPRLRQWHLQSAAPATISRAPSRAREKHPSPLDSCQMLPLPRKHALDAQNAAPATTSAMASPKCCACHDFASPEPRARQHPSPLDSCQMLPLPTNTHSDAQNAAPATPPIAAPATISRAPSRARATTSQRFRQLPNAAPATETHTQRHRMLRLPQLRQWHLQSAAPGTISRAPSRARLWHLQSAAPAKISRAPSRARDNIPAF